MPKWEYYRYEGTPDASLLDKLGAKGWELVAIHNNVLWFKRPLVETKHSVMTKP